MGYSKGHHPRWVDANGKVITVKPATIPSNVKLRLGGNFSLGKQGQYQNQVLLKWNGNPDIDEYYQYQWITDYKTSETNKTRNTYAGMICYTNSQEPSCPSEARES